MSTHAIPADAEPAVGQLVHTLLRPFNVDETGAYVFTPDLTAAEQTRLQRIITIARSGLHFTPDELQTLQPVIAEIRSLRQRTNADWSALTAAQRDADLIAWCRDLTDVLRAMLRD